MSFGFLEELLDVKKGDDPSLEEVLSQGMESKLLDVHTAMPAEVLKYDYKKQVVDVQPVLKKTLPDGTKVDHATIYNVPVAFPRTGDSFISFPIEKGDNVMLVFQSRSIDKWRANGGKVDPEDVRHHSLADAVAYPGLFPATKAAPINNGKDVILKNKGSEIRVKKNGKFQILNGENDLVKLVNDMFDTIRTAVVYTDNGPQKLRHKSFSGIGRRIKKFVA